MLQSSKRLFVIKKSESYYQNILENVLHGSHKRVRSGITDVSTHNMHAEIKAWPKWRHAVGQLLSYNAVDYKPDLQVYLFKPYCSQRKDIALEVFKLYKIQPFEFVENFETEKLQIIDLLRNKCVYEDTLQ